MREIEKEVAARFPKETATHEARVLLDNGLHLHIECRRPGTYSYGFNVTTWPGYLAITGDMGSFVFTRLPDMFAFFRHPQGYINAGYWREKLVAEDRMGTLAYSPDRFREVIVRRFKDWAEGWRDDYTAEERRDLRERIRDEVLSCADDGEYYAFNAAQRFEFDGEYFFAEFWESNLKEYTYQYLWCCHAIVWAIQQYDALKANVEAAA
jgi:hypothetical protein